jgi:hypothetical protein
VKTSLQLPFLPQTSSQGEIRFCFCMELLVERPI